MKIKKKKKKRILLKIVIYVLIALFILVGARFIIHRVNLDTEKANEEKLVQTIKKSYSKYVKTIKETNIYNQAGKVIGKINKDVSLQLEEMSINKDTKYFKIRNLADAYIYYKDISKIDNINISDRYKKYIPYNKNIKTKSPTIFYNEQDEFVFQLDSSYDFEVIIKENDKYGVEFYNQLLYIHKDNIEKVYDNKNTDKNNSSGVAVLNYHAFYDENIQKEKENCTTSICHSKKQFKTHLDYFKEKNIFTVTMNELEMYMDGKLQLPKSVLITIDDGPKTEIAVDLLTEYKMNATIFLVTSWFDEKTYYKTDYIELHSHSHNMHNGGECKGGQGGAIKCWPEAKIQDDLKQSREDLNGSTAFCYPFYEYNSYSERMLKKAGFTMAFIGEVPIKGGYKLATVGGDKFKIPRFVIMTHTTMKDIDNYFKQIK